MVFLFQCSSFLRNEAFIALKLALSNGWMTSVRWGGNTTTSAPGISLCEVPLVSGVFYCHPPVTKCIYDAFTFMSTVSTHSKKTS